MEIKFRKLISEAQTPFKKHDVDAGFDLYATSILTTDNYIQYNTGIAFEIPNGYVGLLFPRSSITNYDLILKNSVGVIDASYRGEIVFRFYGFKFEIFYCGNDKSQLYGGNVYEVGERVGQIVFIEIPKITLIETNELSETPRGDNSFGSSGK